MVTLTRQLNTWMACGVLTLATTTSSFAAIEIDEEDFGPTYDTMIVDTVAGKPLGLIAAIAGTITYVVSAPFAAVGGNLDQSQQKLVVEPWQAMQRCLGCTVAEDNYYKSKQVSPNQVRITVDQPSEIIINTDDNVIVVPQ